MEKQRVFRAPGKVLMAGGYGVLEPHNIGLVLAVQCYFYSTYSTTPSTQLSFHIHSPQLHSTWNYTMLTPTLPLQGDHNPYLQHSISAVLAHFKDTPLKPQQVTIHLLFDKGFLSSPEQEEPSLKFSMYRDSTKQGLGSSACVVVSTVRILCELFGNTSLETINYLSHIANLSAQNKIGSNFDISSAMFGSQLYTNILPEYAQKYILSKGTDRQILGIPSEVVKLNYVGRFVVSLLDLRKGSSTVKMVSSFLSSLASQPKAVQQEFYRSSKSITARLHLLLNQWILPKHQLKGLNREHRRLLQKYSQITGVQIQPETLREFLDELEADEGVLYVICPGSGGYDSVSVLLQKSNREYLISRTISYPIATFGLDCQGVCECGGKESSQVLDFINPN